MPTYNVNVFIGTYVVEVEDEEDAEQKVFELVSEEYGAWNAKNFAYDVALAF